jgi:hypothetical protein
MIQVYSPFQVLRSERRSIPAKARSLHLYDRYRAEESGVIRRHQDLVEQSGFPGRLSRAMAHVRLMDIAIRHRDRTRRLRAAGRVLPKITALMI